MNKPGLIALLLAAATQFPAHAADLPASADCVKPALPFLLDELPAEIQRLLGRGTAGVGGLADRDEAFNATDAIGHGSAPMSRFRWAGQGDDCYAVTLERGGFAHYVETLILRRGEGGWRIVATRAPAPDEMGMPERTTVATATK
ncbi:hypothetical protein [Pseudoduganella armeniaca]|uniref:DUF3828 domain-containing protein n=1 Tax=Pseudoduganella armeniaca TaxID=2072590 RepID=A0A2R4C7J6_9BURK|nr:hypothetical protein [Pseudoduganella armeniaca]AVR95551.1 hypothetical protein C9I28_07280 [Pseudoduganella armeniaca]